MKNGYFPRNSGKLGVKVRGHTLTHIRVTKLFYNTTRIFFARGCNEGGDASPRQNVNKIQ